MDLDQVRLVLSCCILIGLGALAILTSWKPNLEKVGKAFLGLVLSLFSWFFFHTLSFYLSRYSEPSYLVGSMAGIAVMFVGTSLFIFCEYFPEGSDSESSKRKVWIVILLTLLLTPLTLSKLWISNRGASTGAVVGPFFYITSGWVVVLALLGILNQIRKFRTTLDPRKKNRILRLLWTILFHLGLTVFISVVLPILGSWKYFFLGPAASVAGLAFIIYAIQFHPLFNFREALFQVGLKIILGFLLCSSLLICMMLLASYHESAQFSWPLGFFFSIFFLTGLLYGTQIQPKLETKLFPRPLNIENLIEQVFLRQAAGQFQSLETLIREILIPVQEEFGIPNILATVTNHQDKVLIFELGSFSSELKNISSRFVMSRLGRDRRLAKELIQEGDRIFLLDEDASIPFQKKNSFTKKYSRLISRSLRYRKIFVSLGVRIIIPLLFRDEICGYLLLGDKASGRPYFENELLILDKIRTTLAALLRNHIYYERVQFLKNQAEAELRSLKRIQSDREVKKISVGSKSLVFRSESMEDTFHHIQRVAPLSRPVFINGETGTGKELIAQLIHELSRTQEKFVPINCAALPASLWEDEIFGHVRGAFTDAKASRQGAVESAGKGSLFFDEIGEMPLSMQAKMLRLLQERQFTPIGGTESRPAECRFIFATNRNLEEAVKKGEFREDLYYRINVFRIDLPPLRERPEDIEPLVLHLMEMFTKELNSSVEIVSPNVLQMFFNYSWPGNIRELENTLLRALSNASGATLNPNDLPEISKEAEKFKTQRIQKSFTDYIPPEEGNFHEIMNACAKKLIQNALSRSGGNKTQAAKQLGIRRSSLEYRMKELNL
jgi:transcriptional regulator with GAF, ATPase, and Fis domain